MSLSHSAQTFCPGGRLDCGVDGWECCFVSGAETGLSPARAGEHGVITPLCAVGSAISQRSYRTGMHQANWSQLIPIVEKSLERLLFIARHALFNDSLRSTVAHALRANRIRRLSKDFSLISFFFSFRFVYNNFIFINIVKKKSKFHRSKGIFL